jgi:predicted dehydrogenase
MTPKRTGSDPGSPIRVGVVGVGYWGPNLVRNLAESPDFEVAYLCGLQP